MLTRGNHIFNVLIFNVSKVTQLNYSKLGSKF